VNKRFPVFVEIWTRKDYAANYLIAPGSRHACFAFFLESIQVLDNDGPFGRVQDVSLVSICLTPAPKI
jgi:hypothetical protein